jgi:hypothetical protein
LHLQYIDIETNAILKIAKNESFEEFDVFASGEGAEFLVHWGVIGCSGPVCPKQPVY